MFKEGLLKGKRILVTGGGTGLGKEIATRYLQLGAEIWIAGRRGAVLDATAKELTDKHGGKVGTHAVGKRWIAGGHKGSVISILVTWVHTGSPYVVPSAMSKAGLHIMTKSLAVEWGRHGIRLNAIAPGPFPTEGASKRLRPDGNFEDANERNPMRRVGEMPELQNL